jgi:hypothetical protein
VAAFSRSASWRASRSLIFVFSALIWPNIVGIVVGIVALCCLKLIGVVNVVAV